MQSVRTNLSFSEFNRRAEQIVEYLKLTEPVAIIQFGSSLYEEDYLPGLSDLDLCVISERPLRKIENDLGYQPFVVTTSQFIDRVTKGVSFALCALLRGRVLYDPYQFVGGEKGVRTIYCVIRSDPFYVLLRSFTF